MLKCGFVCMEREKIVYIRVTWDCGVSAGVDACQWIGAGLKVDH